MRAPPENRNARLAPGVGNTFAGQSGSTLDSELPDAPQALFTAIPTGRFTWRVKAISAKGEIALLGKFGDRLTALGAALVMASEAGGTATP